MNSRSMHPSLRRLDRLGVTLANDPDVVALLGLGSAGMEMHRFDEHSDIDFFIVVDTLRAKQRYLDSIEWIEGFGGQVAFSFVNDANGRKVLLADGLFLEYAIFTLAELAGLSYTGERVVWRRPGYDISCFAPRKPPPAPAIDTVEFHVDEALTNLFVGLHREHRGERLTAMRFIQVFAVDRILSLVRLRTDATAPSHDPFEPTRRAERTSGLPLEAMVPGYEHNREAAAHALGWLMSNYDTHPVMVREITQLLADDAEPEP